MQRAAMFTLAAAAVLAACARGGAGEPPAPAVLDPVGTYTFSTTVEGATVTGTVTIRGEPGSYRGSIDPDPGGPVGTVPIHEVTVEGQQITAIGDVGGEELVMTLTFTGDTYTGTWIVGFNSGSVTGSRVRQ